MNPTNTEFYENARRTVEYAITKGWAKYPERTLEATPPRGKLSEPKDDKKEK